MVQWFSNKQNFYAMSTNSNENIEEVEFESGKKRYYLKNSSPKLSHSFSFLLKDKAEEVAFWNWYSNILLSRTQTVELMNLVTLEGTKEYQMTEEPSINDSQFPKEVNITVEEV